METKALIIDTNTNGKLQGITGGWQDASTQMSRVTPNIITPDIQEGDEEGCLISAAVSGMPTPFARPTLFYRALVCLNSGSAGGAGLERFYASLVDEWRGLIACIALDAADGKVSVDTIEMVYSDEKGVADTANVYEPKGAFGNMLLDKRMLWCDQQAANLSIEKPKVNIIKYAGKVIGGTSPEVLLFTAPSYVMPKEHLCTNPKTLRLSDPVKLGKMNQHQYLTLWAYLKKLLDRFQQLGLYYASLGPDAPTYTNVLEELNKWTNELEAAIDEKGYDKSNASPLPVMFFTLEPFRSFLNYSDNLYALNGIIYSQEQQFAKSFAPEELLLPQDVDLVRIKLPTHELQEFPLTVLRATKKDGMGYAYFALPLSEIGIRVFDRNIDSLLGISNTISNIGSTLEGEFDEHEYLLKVTLTIRTQEGQVKPITVNYHVNHNVLLDKDLLIWPNFVSSQWNRYLLYSEMPHNDHAKDCPFETVPFCGNISAQGLDTIVSKSGDSNNSEKIALVAVNGIAQNVNGVFNAKLHVVSDHRTNDQQYKYEVYESSKPFRGIQISKMGKVCGYLLIRYTTQTDNHSLPYNYAGVEPQLSKVSLGVDFGSTNTSIAYYDANDGDKGFSFHDHRISLLQGLHNIKNPYTVESSIFFFQRSSIDSNMVKSILSLHDQRRLQLSDSFVHSTAVSGGFPCFNRDLPINNIKDGHISLLFNNSGMTADLINNMKWRGNQEDNNHKVAFLSSLLLHVYAELFVMGKVPNSLKWSYPSSMGFALLQQYSAIWNSLKGISPVVGIDNMSIPLSISSLPNIKVSTDGEDPFGRIVESKSSFENSDFASDGFGDNPSHTFGNDGFDSFDDSSREPFGESASDPFEENDYDEFEGFGEEEQPKTKVRDLVADNGPIEFKIQALQQDTSLTEACAVANYSVKNANANVLTLCFDIGGSTTDISAICYMPDKNGQKQPTLIKQNSVRFAAQRVSEATSVLANSFKDVLLATCNQFGIKMTGLNAIDDKYDATTAPYFYEQMVDLLKPEQQVAFYQQIAAKCQGLFCVNLYVTGLIMYYAGQITEKLIKEVRRAKDGLGPEWKTNVDVIFVGKGSRIFDWFSLTNYQGAKAYCRDQFIHGLGGEDIAKQMLKGWPRFNLNDTVKNDVKYEVAKGLALPSTILYVPQDNIAIEILGEEGFSIISASTGKTTSLTFDNSITTEMMEHLGVYFMTPSQGQSCKCFRDFAGIFYKYASKLFDLKMKVADFQRAFIDMKINDYIQSQPEYRAAKNRKNRSEGDFDYVNPIIILEGMNFYEEYLLKGITN